MKSKSQANFYHCDNCRICQSKDLLLYIDLGLHPPSNSFIRSEDVPLEQKFPLRVYFCQNCGLSQLLDVVSARDIFDEYIYLSSSSKALRNHYQEMVDYTLSNFKLQPGSLVVDIGCNDGITLRCYPKGEFRVLGIEPSSTAEFAKREGFEIIEDFFNRDLSTDISRNYGNAAVITATNVFAHVDDIWSFTEGVQRLLSPQGIFVIEFPYVLDMIEKRYFDTIYHEHLCYLGLTPLLYLFPRTGLRPFKVERVDVGASGPALRLFVCKKDANYLEDKSIKDMLDSESNWVIKQPGRYLEFAQAVNTLKIQLKEIIDGLRGKGSVVGAFSAPAKGNTLLNYLELTAQDIIAVAENNELKVGKLTPGSHIPIINDEKFLNLGISHALLLSWNYADFFLKNSEFIKRGGKFIIPIPRPHITG